MLMCHAWLRMDLSVVHSNRSPTSRPKQHPSTSGGNDSFLFIKQNAVTLPHQNLPASYAWNTAPCSVGGGLSFWVFKVRLQFWLQEIQTCWFGYTTQTERFLICHTVSKIFFLSLCHLACSLLAYSNLRQCFVTLRWCMGVPLVATYRPTSSSEKLAMAVLSESCIRKAICYEDSWEPSAEWPHLEQESAPFFIDSRIQWVTAVVAEHIFQDRARTASAVNKSFSRTYKH